MKINMERNNILEKSILDVAESLFLEKGFSQTTTTMIAREVGCNQSLINYYFRSKEKLFQLVFDKYLQIFVVGLSSIDNESINFEDRIKHCVYSQFEMFQAHPEIVIFLMNELSFNPKNQTAVKEKLVLYITDIDSFLASELKVEINRGNVSDITSIDLIMNIFTLNASVFLLFSIIKKLELFSIQEVQTIIEKRKEENYILILNTFFIK